MIQHVKNYDDLKVRIAALASFKRRIDDKFFGVSKLLPEGSDLSFSTFSF